jgi:hypothetical protein
MAKEKQAPVAAPSEEQAVQLAKISFHLAVLQPDGSYFTEECENLPALVARLKELVDKDVSVFSFAGMRLQTSKPPFRHLLTPWGNFPLFDVPDALEPDDTGYMGVDPIGLAGPTEIKAPSSARPAQAHDDLFADDGGDVMGVFDNVLPDPDS